MKPSKETIEQKLEIIDQNMTFLRQEKKKFTPGEANFKQIQAIKHSLLEISEACIDIASHIIASQGFERPSDYSEMFSVLKRNDIIGKELSENMGEMARFRNFLVHRYDKVEESRLEDIMEEDLEDIKDFVEEIYDYLEV